MPDRRRFASIDIGTNSVKLAIAERGDGGSFDALLDISTVTRLGEGIHAQRLREAAIRRTLDKLGEYVEACRANSVEAIAAVGTSALRDAANRDEFVARTAEFGLEIEAISGDEEARLSFLAVSLDPLWRDSPKLLVIDIGGGSTEIILGDRDGIEGRVSLALGAVRLTESALHSDPPTVAEITNATRQAQESLKGLAAPSANYVAVGVGGTLANMAAVRRHLERPDGELIHGTLLHTEDIEKQIAHYGSVSLEERRQIVGLNPARADIILGGAIVLRETLAAIGRSAISVSSRGLRWGLMYDRFGRD